jgi:3-oxoacyl-[acyl-carrier protein] reductase
VNFDLEGRTAVITGGGQGLGRAYCLGFAEQGAKVAVVDVNAETAANVAKEITDAGGTAAGFQADISSEAAVDEMVGAVSSQLGAPLLLINNAGLLSTLDLKPATEIPAAEWDRVMAVNVKGTFLCAKGCIPAMIEAGYGKIVNISSNTICFGRVGYLHYVTSKMAVIGMARSLAAEFGKDGVRVNTIIPGVVETEIPRDTIDSTLLENVAKMTALRRVEEPKDLLDAALYLCSPASDFVSGQSLIVDGGLYFS